MDAKLDPIEDMQDEDIDDEKSNIESISDLEDSCSVSQTSDVCGKPDYDTDRLELEDNETNNRSRKLTSTEELDGLNDDAENSEIPISNSPCRQIKSEGDEGEEEEECKGKLDITRTDSPKTTSSKNEEEDVDMSKAQSPAKSFMQSEKKGRDDLEISRIMHTESIYNEGQDNSTLNEFSRIHSGAFEEEANEKDTDVTARLVEPSDNLFGQQEDEKASEDFNVSRTDRSEDYDIESFEHRCFEAKLGENNFDKEGDISNMSLDERCYSLSQEEPDDVCFNKTLMSEESECCEKIDLSTSRNLKKRSLSDEIQKEKDKLNEQEAELDFEEEINEDRKEDVESGKNKEIEEDKESDQDEDKNKTEEGEDDGEVDDDDDLEEGEVKDPVSSRKQQPRPICRFYNKGQCTWGSSCRFVHPGVNDKGNYSMFAPSKPLVPSNGPGLIGPVIIPPGNLRDHPVHPTRGISEVPVPAPSVDEASPIESAWERGLRYAKEILKKANKRKEMEPDFEEKRLNLTIGSVETPSEYEKENDYYARSPFRKSNDPYYAYGYDDPSIDLYERQAQEYWRGGNYENFEVRYTRSDYDFRVNPKEDKEKGGKERSRRVKYEKQRSQDQTWRDSRYAEIQINTKSRGDEWKDPWRRSTSPKRRGRSKSYSSASSASSFSSQSSRSHSTSYSSYSWSSSGSSYTSYTSRSSSWSRSRTRPSPHRHRSRGGTGTLQMKKTKTSQTAPARPTIPPEKKIPSPTIPPPPVQEKKKKPSPSKSNHSRQVISYSGSDSRSSRSRSRSRSRSHSSSSRSSLSTCSSSRSSSVISLSGRETKSNGTRRKDLNKVQDRNTSKKTTVDSSRDRDWDHKDDAHTDLKMKSTVSAARASKDPLKQSGQKPQIKLTLLNKALPEKSSSSANKQDSSDATKSKTSITVAATTNERDQTPVSKPSSSKPPNPSEKSSNISKFPTPPKSPSTTDPSKASKVSFPPSGTSSSRKRLASPSLLLRPAAGNISRNVSGSSDSKSATSTTTASKPPAKKSTMSRREELLKQLKAVEDAIARKRAKLT